MQKQGVFFGRKILLISDDPSLVETVKKAADHGAVFYHSGDPKESLGMSLSKNPELIIYDDQMPPFNGNKVLAIIRRARPKFRVLLLTKAGVPLRSIDVTAQGASFTLTRTSSSEQIYNAIKHSLSITSVPRVEQMAS